MDTVEDKNVKVFRAVKSFVDDLWNVFSTKGTSALAVYRRLLSTKLETDADALEKVKMGFARFLLAHEDKLVNNTLDTLPAGATIRYDKSDRIRIDIQKYYSRSDSVGKEAIRRHLINISYIMDPSEQKDAILAEEMSELGIESNTNEGRFIAGIVSKAKESMGDIDSTDPMQATMSLMSSGILQEMIGGLQAGTDSGELDPRKLFDSMKGVVGQFMNAGGDITEIQNTAKTQLAIEEK